MAMSDFFVVLKGPPGEPGPTGERGSRGYPVSFCAFQCDISQ